jgi:hypothetical protein
MQNFWSHLAACTAAGQSLGNAANAASYLTFDVLPETTCPYDASLCMVAPGIEYTEIADLCSPKASQASASAIGNSIDAGLAADTDLNFGEALGDIGKCVDTLVIVLFLSLVIGFVFMILLRFCVGVIVWTAIAVVFFLFALGGGFCYYKSVVCNDDTMTTVCAAVIGGFKES